MLLMLLAFYASTDDTQRTWSAMIEEANRAEAEEEREQFRRYSEDCPSLDEHMDGNARECLCTDPRHPYHRDSRPQCDRNLCPHLHPQGYSFRGCCGCR